VIQHPDVLSRYGSFKGKGEALWKSLYRPAGTSSCGPTRTSGTGIRGSSTARGSAPPRAPTPVREAYYQRPIVEEGVLKEGGGG
jgi:hypothetical protein